MYGLLKRLTALVRTDPPERPRGRPAYIPILVAQGLAEYVLGSRIREPGYCH